MTFAQAKKKLKKIADGRFHRVLYSITENHIGDCTTECSLYISDGNIFSGPTWDDAFRSLDIEMNPPKVDASEQPKGQA